MLIGDRYLASDHSALDLATAEPARLRRGVPGAPMPRLFDRRRRWRLVDIVPKPASSWTEVWERCDEAPLPPPAAIESAAAALAGARDGHPHAVDLIADGQAAWQRAVLDMARAATAAGFVPIAV